MYVCVWGGLTTKACTVTTNSALLFPWILDSPSSQSSIAGTFHQWRTRGGGGADTGDQVWGAWRDKMDPLERTSPSLLNQLLGLEKATQVEHLPGGQADQAAHGEYAEVQYASVGGFIGVPHLLLSLLHVCEIIHNGL